MKFVLLTAFVFLGISGALGATSGGHDSSAQKRLEPNVPPDTIFAKPVKTDSLKNPVIVDSSLAIVTVDSRDDGNVSIMLVMRKKAEVYQNAMSLTSVKPDTLGTWKPPLIRLVPTGIYDILLQKEGFKNIEKRGYAFAKNRDSLSFSFTSLQRRRQLFGTLKWISAGIAVAAAAASIYLHQRVRIYEQEYQGAVSPDVILGLRSKIDRGRTDYRASSSILGPAFAAFAVFWVIEIAI